MWASVAANMVGKRPHDSSKVSSFVATNSWKNYKCFWSFILAPSVFGLCASEIKICPQSAQIAHKHTFWFLFLESWLCGDQTGSLACWWDAKQLIACFFRLFPVSWPQQGNLTSRNRGIKCLARTSGGKKKALQGHESPWSCFLAPQTKTRFFLVFTAFGRRTSGNMKAL